MTNFWVRVLYQINGDENGLQNLYSPVRFWMAPPIIYQKRLLFLPKVTVFVCRFWYGRLLRFHKKWAVDFSSVSQSLIEPPTE